MCKALNFALCGFSFHLQNQVKNKLDGKQELVIKLNKRNYGEPIVNVISNRFANNKVVSEVHYYKIASIFEFRVNNNIAFVQSWVHFG